MNINQNSQQRHLFFMNLALQQAERVLGNTKENPAVGCVITKKNLLVGVGHTNFNGRPHAEKIAIDSCKETLKDANIYVTLEPCSHYGHTPPCVNLIVSKKIKKVFFGSYDPDNRSYNKSSKKFLDKGIYVSSSFMKNKIIPFYKSYLKNREENKSFVTCKLAVSKDFYTINNKKKYITNYFSRGRVHIMRSKHDCIITSSKTINKDDSKLTCRINGLLKRSPSRIIIDKNLRTKLSSNIIKEAPLFKTIIFYNKMNIKKIKLLNKLKVKTFRISLDQNGMIDLKKSLEMARKLGFARIFLECGIKLTTNFLQNNLVDDFKLFVSADKIGKNGDGRLSKNLRSYLKKKKSKIEKVNLFNETLISYNIK